MVERCTEHPLAPLLPRQAEPCGAEAERELAAMEAFYRSRNPSEGPDLNRLTEALESLRLKSPEPPTLWERLVAWFRDYFGSSDPGLPTWMQDFSLNPSLLEWTLYVCSGALVLAAITVVANEIRQLRGARRAAETPGWSAEERSAPQPPQLANLANTPLNELPGILFQILLAKLQTLELLPQRRSLTHREIVQTARDSAEADAITAVARAAERATYGGWQPSPEDARDLTNTTVRALDKLGSPADE